MSTIKPRRRRFRRVLLVGLVGLVVWVGLIGWQVWQLNSHAQTLQVLFQQPQQTSGQTVCTEAQASGKTLRRLRFLILPASPLLRHLGWIPGIGPALQATPSLTDSGAALAALIDTACPTLRNLWPALQAPPAERLPLLIKAAIDQPPDWDGLETGLIKFEAAWQGVPPANLERWPFNRFPALQQVRPSLTDLRKVMDVAREVWPVIHILAGFEQPLRLLVAIHNPAELRPTGGFIGSTAILSITNGTIEVAEFYNTADLGAVAPAGSAMPQPYNEYLRASIWTFRDANWSPDWPRSARLLETFWDLNGLPPVDGVLALNSYVFQDMLQTLGSVDVPQYGIITSLDTVFAQYEGPLSGDKAFLGALLNEMIRRLKVATPQQALAIGAGLAHNFDRRHLSLALHDSTAQRIVANLGWDGSIEPTGQHLQIIDADLSYSDVQPFIDQQITLETRLDALGQPITNTVWLTYTNRYDDWNSSSTPQQIYGFCYNPATQRQQRIPGCYGDYLRAYVPPTVQLIDVIGADAPPTIERNDTHANIGMYVVVMPGETRTIRIDYVNTSLITTPYTIDIFKQAGTNARPFTLMITDANQRSARLQSDLWYDRTFSVSATTAGPAITRVDSDPQNPTLADTVFTKQPTFWQGWQRWEQGDHAAALEHWQATQTLDFAIGQAWALFWRDQPSQAKPMLQALHPHATPEQALRIDVLLAQIERYQGNLQSAQAQYQRIVQQHPNADTARLALALLQHEQGNTAAALEQLRQIKEPAIGLHRHALDQSLQRDYAGADQTLALLLAFDSSDTLAWERRYWLNRYASEPPNWHQTIVVLDAAITRFSDQPIWFERRAEAHQQQENAPAAIADWKQTITLSPTHALAWYSLGIQQQTIDPSAAIASLEQAIALGYSDQVTAYIVLGSIHVEGGNSEAARKAYQRALELAPDRIDVQEALRSLGG